MASHPFELDPRLGRAVELLAHFFTSPDVVRCAFFTVHGVEHSWGSCQRAGYSGDFFELPVDSTRQVGFGELVAFSGCGGCVWNYRPGGPAGQWAEYVLSPVFAAAEAENATGTLDRGAALARVATTSLVDEVLVARLLATLGQGELLPGPVALVRRDPGLTAAQLGSELAAAIASGVHHQEGWSLCNTDLVLHDDVLLIPLGTLHSVPPSTASVFFTLVGDEGSHPSPELLRAAVEIGRGFP